MFAQNLHCWYTLEPPRRGGSPVPTMYVGTKLRKIGIPQFYFIKVGLKGALTCFPDVDTQNALGNAFREIIHVGHSDCHDMGEQSYLYLCLPRHFAYYM